MWIVYEYSMSKLYVLIKYIWIYRIQTIFGISKNQKSNKKTHLFSSVPTFDEKVNIHDNTYFKRKM